MKPFICLLLALTPLHATTISVVPVHEPLSLHGTDVDDDVSEAGEALQATVMARPMALTGAFPETLVEAIRTPHRIPTNNPNYKTEEANLLVLCGIGIEAESSRRGLSVRIDVAGLKIPENVDLTSRQVLKLAIVAIRKTLEEYQRPQINPLDVLIVILGTNDSTASLRDLAVTFRVGGEPSAPQGVTDRNPAPPAGGVDEVDD